jgi:hypothetical protein
VRGALSELTRLRRFVANATSPRTRGEVNLRRELAHNSACLRFDGDVAVFAGCHPPTSASTRSGEPDPFSIFKGGVIRRAPVGGS